MGVSKQADRSSWQSGRQAVSGLAARMKSSVRLSLAKGWVRDVPGELRKATAQLRDLIQGEPGLAAQAHVGVQVCALWRRNVRTPCAALQHQSPTMSMTPSRRSLVTSMRSLGDADTSASAARLPAV